MPARLLVIGWDAADPDLVERLVARGDLPHLTALRERGAYGTIASTTPASSLPAWTTALTGLEPGRHGVIDFVRREPGAYRLRLASARDRSVPTVGARLAASGRRVALVGVPGTFPPEAVDGLLTIAGWDTPAARRAPADAHHPPGLDRELASQGLAWPLGALDELAVGNGWHRRARPKLLDQAARRERVARALLAREDWDLFLVHLVEADTAAHHFWAFHDAASPRHRSDPALADTLVEVYRALDRTVGRLVAEAGDEAVTLVVSDHGAGGASDRIVYLNRWLVHAGFARGSSRRRLVAGGARQLRDRAAAWLPGPVKERVLRSPLARLALATDGLARLGGLDLGHSRAWCDELPQSPGIWLNLRGRDPRGTVCPGAEYEELRDAIIARLTTWVAPETGEALVARVRRREEVWRGPHVDRAPDLLVELAAPGGYQLLAGPSDGRDGPLVRRLAPEEQIGAKGVGCAGVHRPDGVIAAAGPGVRCGGRIRAARLADVMPTLLAVLGEPLPADLDGRVIPEIARAPATITATNEAHPPAQEGAYSPAEEAALRRRLERLGYL